MKNIKKQIQGNNGIITNDNTKIELHKENEWMINWAGLGNVSLEQTKQFAKLLNEAIKTVEELNSK